MTYDFKQPVVRPKSATAGAFTLVEIAVALVLLAGVISGVLVVMNHAVGATMDMRSSQHAFQTAREKLESLLTVSSVSDLMEFGTSEKYPEIRWQLRVEPFYEPISNKMWIRAVSTADYTDSKDQEQTIELEQWLTGLTAQQIKQILDQQKTEEKILEELYNDEDDEIQEMTKICLKQAGLNVTAYEDLLSRQRREKLDYLIENGFNDAYQELVDSLEAEESVFLQDLGVDFDYLDECITLLMENRNLIPGSSSTDPDIDPEAKPDESNPPGPDEPMDQDICQDVDCSAIAPELRPVLCQLMKCCCQ